MNKFTADLEEERTNLVHTGLEHVRTAESVRFQYTLLLPSKISVAV